MVAWVWQDAIPFYKKNPWENIHSKKQQQSKQRNKI